MNPRLAIAIVLLVGACLVLAELVRGEERTAGFLPPWAAVVTGDNRQGGSPQ